MQCTLWAPILVLGTVAQAVAAPPCAGPVRVALHQNGALYDSERGTGIDIALVSALSERLSCEVRFQVLPRTRIWDELTAGRIDLAPSALMTADRVVRAHFLPYLRNKPFTFLRPSVQDLEGPLFASQSALKLGVTKAFAYGPTLDGLVARIRSTDKNRITETTLPTQLLPLLVAGVVDGVLVNPLQISGLVTEVQDQHLIMRDWAPHETAIETYLAFSKDRFSAGDIRVWAEAIEKARTDGSLRIILEQYLPVEVVPALLAPL